MTAAIFVAPYEPEHEVGGKLLELAATAGYPVAEVRTSRDAGLVYIVPDDVAEAFNAVRATEWPPPVDLVPPPEGETIPEDTVLVDDDNNPDTPPVPRKRTGKSAAE